MVRKKKSGHRVASNWSRAVTFHSTHMVQPKGERELVHHIARATAHGHHLRGIGAGHSFSSIADTDGTHVGLDRYRGVASFDPDTGEVTLRAGTRLWEIGPLLARYGRALPVMGDIDRQSIAGAISTGTHGTGSRYTGFSALVSGLKIALANGDVLWCDPGHNPRLFQAARLGLGALGIITEVRMHTAPLYRLHRQEYSVPVSEALSGLADAGAAPDHREFFWSPLARQAVVRDLTHVPVDTPTRGPSKVRSFVESEVVGNMALAAASSLVRKVPRVSPFLGAGVARLMPSAEAVGQPWEIFSESRRVRFRETELSIEADKLGPAFDALCQAFEGTRTHVIFPLEFRRVKRDDVWLSGAAGCDAIYVAAHIPVAEKDDSFLRLVHDTLAEFRGRPHWGKQHWLTATELAPLYPHWGDFLEVRDEVDPNRMFGNDFLTTSIGA